MRKCTFFLIALLKFFIDPIWFFLEYALPFHTNHSPFVWTNHAFWHVIVLSGIGFVFIFIEIIVNQENPPVFVAFLILSMLFMFWIRCESCSLEKTKPKVQKMSHVIMGLFGLIVTVWIMSLCILAIDFWFYPNIAGCLYMILLVFLMFFYCIFWNFGTRLHIRLPKQQKPFSGLKLYVIIFALFHSLVAVATTWISKNWMICLLLQFSSFLFCIDAYSCFNTQSYLLCQHRNLWNSGVYEEIAEDDYDYFVVVRRIYESSKTRIEVPNGFRFDDQLDFGD